MVDIYVDVYTHSVEVFITDFTQFTIHSFKRSSGCRYRHGQQYEIAEIGICDAMCVEHMVVEPFQTSLFWIFANKVPPQLVEHRP